MTKDSSRRVSVAAVLPGPRNGMTLMTQRIVEELGDRYPLRLAAIGKTYRRSGWTWSLSKAIESLFVGLKVLTWHPRKNESLYLSLNSHGGLWYNLWHALAGRIRGFSFVAHHHVWSYISKPDRRMSWLCSIMGRDAIHVVACPEMAAEMRCLYGDHLKMVHVTPGIVGFKPVVDHPKETQSHQMEDVAKASLNHGQVSASSDLAAELTVGMLSNLTLEKGVDEALATLEAALSDGIDCRLALAGPINDPVARDQINEAIDRHQGRVNWLGPLYGKEKEDFYKSIDVFIFPTRYRNESWGIVLNEALMSGVPAITYIRGCTHYVVGESGGLVIRETGTFADAACKMLQYWASNPQRLEDAKRMARERGDQLRNEAESKLKDFLDMFGSGNWSMIQPSSEASKSAE